VPWLPLPDGHRYPQAPQPSPSLPVPVPAGTPPCRAVQLEGVGSIGGAAAGNVNYPLVLRNRSASACFLEGYADVSVLDAAGGALAQAAGGSGRGTFFDDPPVLPVMMEPGTAALSATAGPPASTDPGQARMNLQWYDCRRPQAASLLLGLPAGGARLAILFPLQAAYSPACDSPGHTTTAGLLRGPLSPSGLGWTSNGLTVPVSIVAPASVRAGSILRYTVTLTDRSAEAYVLSPCPDYNEFLGAKEVVASYQLNCAPVGVIPAGGTATFEMRFAVPATVVPGTKRLAWALVDGRLAIPTAATAIAVL
jgi:hypothetical protein